MNVLVVGLGQVGSALLASKWPEGLKPFGQGHAELDITDRRAVLRKVTSDYAVVVNAAAYTSVDGAESERDAAWSTNAQGPGHLAAACAAAGIPLIHLSTDYVFDGTKAGAYREDDPIRPLNAYGESKAAGERAVRERLDRHLILRTAWVFSASGRNFVRTVLRLAEERDELRIVADQHGAPTAAADIATAIVALIEQILVGRREDAWGTYHVTNEGRTSWHGLAEAVLAWRAAQGGRPVAVRAISTQDYPTPAARPRNSVLDCSKLHAAFGLRLRPWQDALTDVLDSSQERA